MQKTNLIELDRSVIVAADVSKEYLTRLVTATSGISGIRAIKYGLSLGLKGLDQAITLTQKCYPEGEAPVAIYDHQKAGNDIPEMGKTYARTLADCGVDAAIIFPFTGPATQEAWTNALDAAGLTIIAGGVMTHEKFLAKDGGYISDEAPKRIYEMAAEMGVRHFVVPGNKLDWVQKIKGWLDEKLGEGNYVLYAPGFIKQGGDLSECGKIAGKRFHGIVGGGIYGKEEINTEAQMRAAALECTSKLGIAA